MKRYLLGCFKPTLQLVPIQVKEDDTFFSRLARTDLAVDRSLIFTLNPHTEVPQFIHDPFMVENSAGGQQLGYQFIVTFSSVLLIHSCLFL